jgi:hypothetical protein
MQLRDDPRASARSRLRTCPGGGSRCTAICRSLPRNSTLAPGSLPCAKCREPGRTNSRSRALGKLASIGFVLHGRKSAHSHIILSTINGYANLPVWEIGFVLCRGRLARACREHLPLDWLCFVSWASRPRVPRASCSRLALFCVVGVSPARAESILLSIGFVFSPIRLRSGHACVSHESARIDPK